MDHILIGIRDLDQTPRVLGDILGFKVTPEGSHPGRGTNNRLIVFENEYLELLAINDPSADLYRPNLADFLESREGLFIFAMGTDDVDEWYSELKSGGVVLKEPVDGSRAAGDGSSAYGWRQTEIDAAETPGSQTFLIQHHRTIGERYSEPPDPTSHPNGVVGIDRLVLAVRDSAEAASTWQRVFGLERAGAQDDPSGGTRRVRLGLGGCHLDFVSPLGPGPLSEFLDRHGQAPYLLGLKVSDLSETTAFLNQRGVPVREERTGHGDASVLVDPVYAHGMPLEFVQAV